MNYSFTPTPSATDRNSPTPACWLAEPRFMCGVPVDTRRADVLGNRAFLRMWAARRSTMAALNRTEK